MNTCPPCEHSARTSRDDILEPVKAAAVVTSGRGGALECHYDPEDLVILQIAGTKRWQVFNSPAKSPEGPPIFDQVLQPGDLLFLPARYWHHCENGPHRSLHVSLIFTRPNGRHLMTELVSQLSSDETFSRPLTRHSRPEALAEHETALKARLVEAIQGHILGSFPDEACGLRSARGHPARTANQSGPRRVGLSRT